MQADYAAYLIFPLASHTAFVNEWNDAWPGDSQGTTFCNKYITPPGTTITHRGSELRMDEQYKDVFLTSMAKPALSGASWLLLTPDGMYLDGNVPGISEGCSWTQFLDELGLAPEPSGMALL